MAPFSAALMERFGVKRVVVSAVVTIGAMLLLGMGMTSLWQLTAAVRVRSWHRHGADRARDVGDHLDALVHRAARARHRPADRKQRDRSARLPAARRLAREPIRLARRAAAVA